MLTSMAPIIGKSPADAPSLPPAASLCQVIYVTAKLASAWPPGEVRTYYLWAGFARTAGSRLFWIPFRAPGQGIVVQGFSNEDSQDPGRIAVRLVNAASAMLDVSADVRFGVQVGP